MDQNAIELVDITKKYGSFTAVDHLNLTIKKSEVFGLLGPNGAGKSTTILMMLGLTEPTSGLVSVCGINSTTNPIAVKQKVGYLPEDVGFYNDLTGIENLVYTARLNGFSRNEAEKSAVNLMNRVGLSNDINKKAGKYSRGMRQRLGLADVLIKKPEIIILDEPTSGIDPTGVRDFLNLIVELSRQDGITVLFSSHNLHQVQQVCDHLALFVHGKVIADGNVQDLSDKLFGNEPFVISAGISLNGKKDTIEEDLNKIEGVSTINRENNIFNIGCSKDVTPEIAKVIVNSGMNLNYLHRKEYGLDEIYNRYFEVEEKNERK